MKYFIDQEFISGFHKPLFGKRRHFIDLISIGIVCEDGREYYAVSNEFNYKDADSWVKENIIDKLETELFQQQNTFAKTHFNFGLKTLLKQFGKTNKQIATEIYQFVCPYEKASEYAGVGSLDSGAEAYLEMNQPEFYGYYADYDWVLFCSLFGRMIDLPKGFPMYCKDLKQMLDEKAEWFLSHGYGTHTEGNKVYPESLGQSIEWLKSRTTYPKQENEHNALDDAKWNKRLYEFINSI